MDIGLINKFYFYLSMGTKAAAIEYTYELKDAVDEDALKLAVKDAMEVFPFFRIKPFLTQEGELVFVENNAEIPVHKGIGNQVRLGTSDTNGYLFRVAYEGKNIELSAHHGIGDGRGIGTFGQSVVYFYLLHCGQKIDSEGKIYTKDDIGDPTLTETVVEKVTAMNLPEVSEIVKSDAKIFSPNNERIYQETEDSKRYQLEWNQDEFIQVVKSYGGTPVTFVHAVIASTMYDYYKLTEEQIVANVPVDLRSKLDSRAQSNFTYNVDLSVMAEDLKLDMDGLVAELRKRLKKATDLNVMLAGLKKMASVGGVIENIRLTDKGMMEQFSNQMLNGEISRSYLLSNIGAVDLPKDMIPFITNMDVLFPDMEYTPVYVMFTYNNKGTLLIAQNYEDDGFVDALCNKFKDYGVNVKSTDCGLIRVDRLNPLEFDKI